MYWSLLSNWNFEFHFFLLLKKIIISYKHFRVKLDLIWVDVCYNLLSCFGAFSHSGFFFVSPAEGAPGSHVKCCNFEYLCCRSWCCLMIVHIVLTEAWQAHHETAEYSRIILKKILFPSQLSPSTLKMIPPFKSLQDTSNIICMLTSVVTLVFIVWLWHFAPVLMVSMAVWANTSNYKFVFLSWLTHGSRPPNVVQS